MAYITKRQSRPFFLTELQDEINRLFDLNSPVSNEKGLSAMMGDFAPAIDIKDEKDHYLIKADLPGVDPKNIEVTMHDSLLTIRGEKETDVKQEKDDYVRVERAKGIFCRQFSLPESVDSDNISAKSKNGVLEIIIPKSQKNASKRINVNVEQ